MLIPHLLSFFFLIATSCSVFSAISFHPILAGIPNQEPLESNERERGIELYNQKRFSEAIQALRKAVAANKGDYEAWHFLGLALIQNKDLENAIKSLQTALKLQPELAAAHTALSYALMLRTKS